MADRSRWISAAFSELRARACSPVSLLSMNGTLTRYIAGENCIFDAASGNCDKVLLASDTASTTSGSAPFRAAKSGTSEVSESWMLIVLHCIAGVRLVVETSHYTHLTRVPRKPQVLGRAPMSLLRNVRRECKTAFGAVPRTLCNSLKIMVGSAGLEPATSCL